RPRKRVGMRHPRASLLAALILLSATAFAAHAEDLVERPARTSSRDVKIPHELVKSIEEEYRAYLKKNQFPVGEVIKRQMLNLSIELTQKKPVALHEDTRVVTP